MAYGTLQIITDGFSGKKLQLPATRAAIDLHGKGAVRKASYHVKCAHIAQLKVFFTHKQHFCATMGTP